MIRYRIRNTRTGLYASGTTWCTFSYSCGPWSTEQYARLFSTKGAATKSIRNAWKWQDHWCNIDKKRKRDMQLWDIDNDIITIEEVYLKPEITKIWNTEVNLGARK